MSDTEVKNVNIANVTTDAVTAWDNDRYIAFENDGSTRREITQDTVIIYVDSADKEAADGEGVAGISIADDPNADGVGYTPNVRYILSGNTVAFLLVDVNRDMALNPATFQGTISDTSDVQDALDAGWGVVEIDSALASGTISVGDGQTVNITANQTNNQTINLADGATLNVTTAQSGTLTVTAAPGATVTAPNGTLMGSNGVFSSTDDVTIATASNGIQVSASSARSR